jgi:hypothetical protein
VVEVALGADRSLVGQNYMLRDGESEASAPGFPRARFIDAVETLEKTVQMFGGNAWPEVSDVKFDAVRSRARSENNFLS